MIRRPPRSTPFPTRRSSDLTAPHARVLREPHAQHFGERQPRQLAHHLRDHGARLGAAEIEPGHDLTIPAQDRKSTRLNSSHGYISYAVFCLKKKNSDDMRGP